MPQVRESEGNVKLSRDSIYRVPDDAPSVIFGDFPNCQILGDPCTIRVTPLEAFDDSRAVDILGFNSFCPGGIAIHISGKDDFGHKAGPTRIHALGLQEMLWIRQGKHPSGTGCAGPEAVAILDHPIAKPHVALWGRTDSILTLQGVYHWDACDQQPFSVGDIADYINARDGRLFNLGKQQVAAIRALLEACVGATSHGIVSDDGKIGVARLMRAGRGRYRWRRAEEESEAPHA